MPRERKMSGRGVTVREQLTNPAVAAPETEEPIRFATLIVFCLPTLAAFGPFIPGVGSMFAFRIASILLLLVAVFGARSKRRSLTRRSTIALATVWLFATLISLFIIGPATQAWSELLSLVTGLAALLAISMLPSPRRMLVFFLRGWLLAYVIVSAFALAEVITGTSISASGPVERTIDGWGITVAFFNPNNYATFLLYSFLAIFALWTQVRTAIAKSTCLAALASIPILMTLTNSRTGLWILATFIAASILLFLRSRALLRLALIAVTITISLVVLANMDQTPFEELANYVGSAGYSVDVLGVILPVDSSTYVRWELVLAGASLAAIHPLFGGGPGSFESFVASSGMDGRTLGIISPHNGFMEVLSQYGIFVFVALVVWLGNMLLIGVRLRRVQDRTAAASGTVLILGIVALPFVLTMHSSALEPSTTWLFFVLLLLLARGADAMNGTSHNWRTGDSGNSTMSAPRSGDRIRAIRPLTR